jgi:hypothetical protein
VCGLLLYAAGMKLERGYAVPESDFVGLSRPDVGNG